MGRKSKFIAPLTEDEKTALQAGYSHGSSPLFRRKCHCILQRNAGKTTKELADFFQVSTISVLTWLKLWETEGIAGLKLKTGRGRKPKLDTSNAHHVKIIKNLIENEHQSLREVRNQVATQLGLEVSQKTLQRFLKRLTTEGKKSAKK